MKTSFRYYLFVCSASLLLSSCQKTITSNAGRVQLTFRNIVNNSPMVLDIATYSNPFGESYTINQFKYYISNVYLTGSRVIAMEKESYHLVNQRIPGSLTVGFELAENTFSSLHFLIGVDSIRNVSGAQTDALDPLNDMFWTWNSGYVMAKMEGTSPRSNQAGNKIVYHIGGFSGVNRAQREISLAFPPGKQLIIKPGQTSEIMVDADFNKWWQTPNDIQISTLPVCTSPGEWAKKIADNYSNMFTVKDVVNH